MSFPGAEDSQQRTTTLAVHSGALGDVILFGHLLANLPGETTLAAPGEKARLLAGAGVVAAAIDFDSLPIDELFVEPQPEQSRLGELLGGYQRLISCFGEGDLQAQLRLSAACGAAQSAFLPIRPPAGSAAHLLENWRDMLGLPHPIRPADWSVPDAWLTDASRLLREVGVDPGRPYHVLHPGAGAEAKRWDADGFRAAADVLEQPVFVLGPVERDRWDETAIDALRATAPVIDQPALSALTGVLAGSAGYVGNDSGVSHLSAALGTPTVAIFTATSPEQFAPLGPRVSVLDARDTDVGPTGVLSALADLRS
ncbi:MAG: glycosyltransferase family 9 protein [Phycisphaerae bacterium]